MTTAKPEVAPVYELIGHTLSDLGAHYQILILRFQEDEYEIHASCFARIVFNGAILLTTRDYQSWDEKDHRHNDLYFNIAQHGAALIGQRVKSVEVSPVNDLFIVLDNGARIEIFNSDGHRRFSDEREQWFFYKPKDETFPFLSVNGESVERGDKE